MATQQKIIEYKKCLFSVMPYVNRWHNSIACVYSLKKTLKKIKAINALSKSPSGDRNFKLVGYFSGVKMDETLHSLDSVCPSLNVTSGSV